MIANRIWLWVFREDCMAILTQYATLEYVLKYLWSSVAFSFLEKVLKSLDDCVLTVKPFSADVTEPE